MTQPALNLFDDAALDPDAAHAVRRLAIAGFHALWAGRDVALGELVDGDATVVAAAVDDLRAGGRIEFSDDGHVIAVHGLTRRPTPHRIEHHGGVMHTSCALDAIGIPAALAIDARALTHPTCGTELTVTLTRGEHPARFPVWSCGTPRSGVGISSTTSSPAPISLLPRPPRTLGGDGDAGGGFPGTSGTRAHGQPRTRKPAAATLFARAFRAPPR